MNQFWKKIWGVCLLRVGPQDIPESQSLLIITVLAYFGISFVLATMNLDIGTSFASAAVDVVLLLLASYVVLWVKLTPNRWYQTATCLAGSNAIIGAIALPVAAIRASLGTDSSAAAFPMLILIGIMVWTLIVIAHIFKHALDVNIYIGALFSGFYMYLSLKVMTVLFFQAD